MMRFWIFVALALVLISCSAEVERPLQPIRPTPTLGASVTGQAEEITFQLLNEAPDKYLNKLLRVTGEYAPLPYPPLCKHYVGPRPTWSMIGDGLQMSAVGYEGIISLLKEGQSVTLDGVWRLYYGPMGCGKEPATQFLWYLDVRRIVQPNPIVMNTGTSSTEEPLPTDIPILPTATPEITATVIISTTEPVTTLELTPTVIISATETVTTPAEKPEATKAPASGTSQPKPTKEPQATKAPVATPIPNDAPTEQPPSENYPAPVPDQPSGKPTESAEYPAPVTDTPSTPLPPPPSADPPTATAIPLPTEEPIIDQEQDTPLPTSEIVASETPIPTEEDGSEIEATPTLVGIEQVSPTPETITTPEPTVSGVEITDPTETPTDSAESTPLPTSTPNPDETALPTTSAESESTPTPTPTTEESAATPTLPPTEEDSQEATETPTPASETTIDYVDEITPTPESDANNPPPSGDQSATATPVPPSTPTPEGGYPPAQEPTAEPYL